VISAQLPALQVVIPLLAGPACLLLHHPRLSWALATTASWMTFFVSLTLLDQVLSTGTITYALGGWAAPWGIEYRVDEINAFVLLIVSGISAITLPFARSSIEHEINPDRVYILYTGWMLCLTGLLGITITGDAFNVFVFLEIASLSSYLLISLSRDRRSLTAAFQYLVMGTIGATFILIGIALLYMMTGTLNMMDLSQRIPAVSDTRTVKMAFTFLIVGIGLKAAVFPLHFWLPNAYAYAPSAVTALFAGTATKVAVYLLLRFFFTVFGVQFSFEVMELDQVLLPLALAGIFIASTIAIFQTDVKRMLGYSSIAQIGYMVLGISLVSVPGVTAAILHLFNHALMKVALFVTLGCVFFRVGSVMRDDLAGIGRKMPWTMAAFVVGGLSLVGVPLTVGFISKWYLIVAALDQQWWWLAVLVLASSLLALVYIWQVIEVAYFKPAEDQSKDIKEAPATLLIPTWILIIANIYFGLDTSLTVGVAERAASLLLGVAS
jgi:multicomponent Na+:H+ antiporter subunit D